MGKKSVKPKKKGPKGKRARSKAKLERQWGEEAQDDDNKVLRGSAVRKPSRSTIHDNDMEQELPPQQRSCEKQTTAEDETDDEQVGDVKSFIESLRQQYRREAEHDTTSTREDKAMQVQEDEDDESEDDRGANKQQDENSHDDTEEWMDPFTERFSRKLEEKITASNNNSQDGTKGDKSDKIPLSFIEEGTTLQLTLDEWPPSDSLTEPLPTNRHEWRRCMRSLWKYQKQLLRDKPKPKSPAAQVMYPLVSSYMDICQTIPGKHSDLERLYASHILNHVWTSRHRIYEHDKELKTFEKDLEIDLTEGNDDPYEEFMESRKLPKFRDQGFTRASVLVLLPTRGTCYQFIQTLLNLLYGDDDSARATSLGSRFVAEYGPPEEVDVDPRRKAVLQQKGEEWNSLFGDNVNDDDDFKLGVTLHLKGKGKPPSLKLYTDFSKSDLILASPLGLKMWKAKEGGNDDDIDEEAAVSAPDFLSSIEICWISHAHVLVMQNWDHVNDVLSWLNQRPKNTTDTDFSRIRPYFLEESVSSAAWRQLILTAPYLEPEMKSVFGRYARSRAGAARLTHNTSWPEAAMNQIALPIRQVFQRIVVSSVQEQADARLEYFTKNVLRKIDRGQQPFTLIFVPSYFEFVSLRNYLLKREADYFVNVTEYSRHTEVSRGRARFGQGRKSIMLYTGRAHYFHRHEIRGVRHVIWYGLPSDPAVYHQVVGWCQDDETQTQHSKEVPESSVLALYTAYEAHALERIVGRSHCSRMTKGNKTTFLFAT